MHYQLVLQLEGDSLAGQYQLASLLDALTERLGDTAEVDGHHVGSGRTNIFIMTPDPPATFARAKPVLESRHSLAALTASYRPVDGKWYRLIWPDGPK